MWKKRYINRGTNWISLEQNFRRFKKIYLRSPSPRNAWKIEKKPKWVTLTWENLIKGTVLGSRVKGIVKEMVYVFFKVNFADMKLAYYIRLLFCFHVLMDCVCLLPSIVCISFCSQADSLVCWSVPSSLLPLFCLFISFSVSQCAPLKAASMLPGPTEFWVTDRMDQVFVDTVPEGKRIEITS